MIVKLTYFKRTGKLYASGEYETKFSFAHQIYQEVALMRIRNELPGLAPQNQMTFIVLVEIPGSQWNIPQLIGADDAQAVLEAIFKLGPRHDRQLSEPTDEDIKKWEAWDAAYKELCLDAELVGVSIK